MNIFVLMYIIKTKNFFSTEQKLHHKEELFCDTLSAIINNNTQAGITFFNSLNNEQLPLFIENPINFFKAIYFNIAHSRIFVLPITHPEEKIRIENMKKLQKEIDRIGKIEDPITFAFNWVDKHYPTAQ